MAESGARPVVIERRGAVAWVTITRPEKLNALNHATLAALGEAFESLRAQTGPRAVVLTGAGLKAFAAGADIAELADLDATAALEASRFATGIFDRIAGFPVPVIAAVNGYALGGGLELAMACTLRIAGDTARLGQPEIKLGLIPGYGGTQRLPRLIGEARAVEMILLGEPVTAAEALRLGLVNRVVPAAELLAAAEIMATAIAAQAPLAVRRALEAVRAAGGGAPTMGPNLESSLFALCCATQDMREGTAAFLAKRTPKFEGR